MRYWLECNGVSQNASTATMAADYEKVCDPGEVYSRYVTVQIEKSLHADVPDQMAGLEHRRHLHLVGKRGCGIQ